jgi:hypothetical protein
VQLKPLQKRVEMKTLLSKKVNIPHVYRSIMGWIMKLCSIVILFFFLI